MHSLRPVVVTVLLGLLMTMTQAPAQAAIVNDDPPTSTPNPPMAGELFSLTGELPEEPDPARPKVYLQRLDSGTWRTVTTYDRDSDPKKYKFDWRISAPTSFRVVAYRPGDDIMVSATRYVRIAAQYVAASIERVCNASNDCENYAKAVGQVSPPRGPRLAVLQYKSGSSWKSLSVKDYTDSDGKFETPKFAIGSWSQWSAKVFRVAVGRHNGSAYAVSAPITLMPGPQKLGDNVLRVDVSGGSFPSRKGVDYGGYATLIQQGSTTPIISRARLDKFGVRGSTTAAYPKKPYNLRFASDPGSGNQIFGMKADKRWTLLAMYADQSYVRDKTALDLGRKLSGMTWNPESRYVELFVNSLYMGAYLLTEKVDIDGDKVDVSKTTGMIMETDMDTVSDYRKGFRTARGGMIFAFKEPDSLGGSEGITPGKLSAIKNKAAAVESYLYTTNRSYYRSVIDRDSAADFYLAQEFIKDTDADFWRSKYFTWDYNNGGCGNELCDGKLHFGPLWDFDKSIGNIDATNPATAFIRSYRGWHANGTGIGKAHHVTYHTHWFAQLWKVPAFRAYLQARWAQVRGEFYKTAVYEVDKNKAAIGWGRINDRYRWAGASKLYQPKGSSYDDEVRYVKSWLVNRFRWMDSQL